MEDQTTESVVEAPQDLNCNNEEESKETVADNLELDTIPVLKDDKSNDSDAKSEKSSNIDDQIDVNMNSNSQFYESSDSKIGYAVKIDDNDTLSDVDDIKTDSASADSEDSALGSLPPDVASTEREEEVQDRSDGSDSGIGSETNEDAKMPNFGLDIPCTSGLRKAESNDETAQNFAMAEEPADISMSDQTNTPAQKCEPLRSNLKRKYVEGNETTEEVQAKKKKRSITFENVTVYYFSRAQGFSCVPSQGGSTLGMEREHTHVDRFTLAEHAMEQRRLHRQILQQLKNERHSLEGVTFSSSEDSDTEEEASDISESELDLDSYYFLQPVTTRQRRALLRAAGVRKIEGYEKDECRDIRTSREFCGCACKGVCNPDTCSCSASGIKCQVDRLNFPCGCTRDGCNNTTGRIEFNPVRVRTHFIHTLMRLGLEKKNEEQQEAQKRQWAEARAASATCSMSSMTSYERERCHNHDDGLLRDVSLTPRVEVESCVNAGSFSNVHTANPANHQPNNMQEDMNYRYRENAPNHLNISENNVMHMGNSNHSAHADPYSSNMLQGKSPPYSMPNNIDFNTMSHNVQRFPCDLNYSYTPNTDNNHHFKNLQSFSASSFEEFAHNSHMNMFSHYGQMYVPEYLHKQNAMHEQNTLQYHPMTQDHYQGYKNIAAPTAENIGEYTTLMSLPYHASNTKLQAVENDENWYSHNTLLGLEQTESTQEAPEAPAQCTEAPADSATETTDNFGELIKKTMVESVSV